MTTEIVIKNNGNKSHKIAVELLDVDSLINIVKNVKVLEAGEELAQVVEYKKIFLQISELPVEETK